MGNKQSSPEGFNNSTNAVDIVQGKDLSNLNVIITGCNTGIGKETMRVLYKQGAHVIMACRNQEKMDKAADEVINSLKDDEGSKVGKIERCVCDLGDLKSIEKFANEMKEKDFPLNSLLCNAGVMMPPMMRTSDEFELQIGTNHLGHFALVNQLLPLMKKHCNEKNKGRIVVVSSEGHKFGAINLEDLNYEKRSYSSMKGYGQSKLANILFTKELDRYLQMDKELLNISAFCLHPGVIKTELGRYSKFTGFFTTVAAPLCKTIPQGAATTVYCAVGDNLEKERGKYFYDCHVGDTNAEGKDMVMAKKLWAKSEELTKVKYPFEIKESEKKEDSITKVEEEETDEKKKEESTGEPKEDKKEEIEEKNE